jgi:membrane protein involved in colicin uptake
MSDELNTLQETAAQARAKADELTATLTPESSDEEKTAADEAEKAAVDAESAFAEAQAKATADAEAEAKAKADAEAAAQGGDAPKAGDPCTDADGVTGTLQDDGTGNLVCVVEQAPDANASRTGFVDSGRPGDECTCPDGRKGTVHRFDEGLICLPNQG